MPLKVNGMRNIDWVMRLTRYLVKSAIKMMIGIGIPKKKSSSERMVVPLNWRLD